GQLVAGDLGGVLGLEREDAFAPPRRGGDDADHHDAEPGMGERRAIGRAWQIAKASHSIRQGSVEQLYPEANLRQRAADQPYSKPDAERRKPGPALLPSENCYRDNEREDRCSEQALAGGGDVPPLPGKHRPEGNGDEQRHEERHEGVVEEWSPDGN